MSGFAVLKPGVLTTIQDGGRTGQFHLGLTNGGPMDRYSFEWANQLVGNRADQSVLEITLGGLQLRALTTTRIAVTGAEMDLRINGISKERWRSHSVYPNDTIELAHAKKGCRAYLVVAGGFIVPNSFGSTSTVIREGIGGINGGALKRGDFLPCLDHDTEQHLKAPTEIIPVFYSPKDPVVLTRRIILGYQSESLQALQDSFFKQEYTISQAADRMGYRLQGSKLSLPTKALYSEGISYGAVQIPPDGQPIILLNDRQTIGGYPKMGTVLSSDCYRLAQAQHPHKVHFKQISLEEAQRIKKEERLTEKNCPPINIK